MLRSSEDERWHAPELPLASPPRQQEEAAPLTTVSGPEPATVTGSQSIATGSVPGDPEPSRPRSSQVARPAQGDTSIRSLFGWRQHGQASSPGTSGGQMGRRTTIFIAFSGGRSSHGPRSTATGAFLVDSDLGRQLLLASVVEEFARMEDEMFALLLQTLDSQQANTIPPASESAREAQPQVVVTKEDLLDETNSHCAICLERHLLASSATRMLCGHLFCTGCIEEWLRTANSCPVCRYELSTDSADFETGRLERMRSRKARLKEGELQMMEVEPLKRILAVLGLGTHASTGRTELLGKVLEAGTGSQPPLELTKDRDDVHYEEGELRGLGLEGLRRLADRHGLLGPESSRTARKDTQAEERRLRVALLGMVDRSPQVGAVDCGLGGSPLHGPARTEGEKATKSKTQRDLLQSPPTTPAVSRRNTITATSASIPWSSLLGAVEIAAVTQPQPMLNAADVHVTATPHRPLPLVSGMSLESGARDGARSTRRVPGEAPLPWVRGSVLRYCSALSRCWSHALGGLLQRC